MTVLCNTWKTAAPQATAATAQISGEIDVAIQALIDTVVTGTAEKDDVFRQMAAITLLLERRGKLITLK